MQQQAKIENTNLIIQTINNNIEYIFNIYQENLNLAANLITSTLHNVEAQDFIEIINVVNKVKDEERNIASSIINSLTMLRYLNNLNQNFSDYTKSVLIKITDDLK
jgi:hypothetical protein